MHEDFGRKEEQGGPSDRSFGLTFAVVFALLAVAPLLRGRPLRWWAAAVGAVFLLAAAAFPGMLRVPNRLWMKLAFLIGKITNPIITALMFYLLFTPVAFICRLLGKDLLRLEFDNEAETYWIPRQPAGPPPETMRNQF
jgi:hypothetical protein